MSRFLSFFVIIFGLFACQLGTGTKFTDVDPCTGANMIDGQWEPESIPLDPIYDGVSYDNDVTGCQSVDYYIMIDIGGNRNPDYSGATVWGGVENKGTVDVRDWFNATPWVTRDAMDFADYTDSSGVTNNGWSNVSCSGTGSPFTCESQNDWIISPDRTFTFTVSSSDPDVATYADTTYFDYAHLGDLGATGDATQDCTFAAYTTSSFTMARVDYTSYAPNGLGDYEQVVCDTASTTTSSSTTSADSWKYNGKSVRTWVFLVRSWWSTNGTKTYAKQITAAKTFVNTYVISKDRAMVNAFVAATLTSYHAYGFVQQLIDNGYMTLTPLSSTDTSGETRKLVDEIAWGFGRKFTAWAKASGYTI